jgi:GNAT superfamily N-acetyltransferase
VGKKRDYKKKSMIFREAVVSDIPQIQIVRNAVKENTLSNPALVTDADVEDYITRRGKGWVCEIDYIIVGFAIADLVDKNIWALFINPEVEAKGIGKKLHELMMNWYFSQTDETVWLSTTPGTRAKMFYKMQGWKEIGVYGKGEIKFEMKKAEWEKKDAVSDTTAAQ